MNEHPEIQDFQERAAIMEYDAYSSEPKPSIEESRIRRELATLAAAKCVWGRVFTSTTLKIHLMSLRQSNIS